MINTNSVYGKDSIKVDYTKGEKTVKIVTPDHEEGFGILLKNGGASSVVVTVKAGNSILSVGDLSFTIEANSEYILNLKDTGRYKNVYGEDAGRIVIEIPEASASNISLFPFEL